MADVLSMPSLGQVLQFVNTDEPFNPPARASQCWCVLHPDPKRANRGKVSRQCERLRAGWERDTQTAPRLTCNGHRGLEVLARNWAERNHPGHPAVKQVRRARLVEAAKRHGIHCDTLEDALERRAERMAECPES